ncbi:MAG: hypothetical protein M3O84_06680 [Actinomycetota bacterium]|nr:hypothetical protein [Actinomycetota bacterium]
MSAIIPPGRRVYVLGKHALLEDLGAVARRAYVEDIPLVILSLGYPVSRRQQAIVDEALALAGELRIRLDVRLVTSLEQLPAMLAEGDEVAVLSSGFERLRLEWLLRERLEQRERVVQL